MSGDPRSSGLGSTPIRKSIPVEAPALALVKWILPNAKFLLCIHHLDDLKLGPAGVNIFVPLGISSIVSLFKKHNLFLKIKMRYLSLFSKKSRNFFFNIFVPLVEIKNLNEGAPPGVGNDGTTHKMSNISMTLPSSRISNLAASGSDSSNVGKII